MKHFIIFFISFTAYNSTNLFVDPTQISAVYTRYNCFYDRGPDGYPGLERSNDYRRM